MSLLNIATMENATGEVKEVYDEIHSMFGMVPNGIKTFSVNPKALKAQWDGIKDILSKDKDNQVLYSIIRYLMSNKNDCEYCIGLNASMLINQYGVTEDELDAIKKDPKNAPLNEKNSALLLFAIKSVENPHAVNSSDIDALKKVGASEMEIFDVVHEASHMFLVNTLFDTFKVEKD
jgi:uncharacterized peroxidase-related enzyme